MLIWSLLNYNLNFQKMPPREFSPNPEIKLIYKFKNKRKFRVKTLLSFFWFFCDIFLTVNGRVLCHFLLTVIRHIVVKKQSPKSTAWLTRYGLKKSFKDFISKTLFKAVLKPSSLVALIFTKTCFKIVHKI